jgi:NTE family protein
VTTNATWRSRTRRPDPEKVALVCAGGGLTGAAYEAGCLLALEELLDRSLTDLDVYLGVSAGAVLTALLANGVSPVEMAGALSNEKGQLFGYPASRLFRFTVADALSGAMALPRLAAGLVGFSRGSADPLSALDRLGDGFLDNSGVRECVENALAHHGGSNSFDALPAPLYILAVDIDSGHVVAFGEEQHRDVPISRAVQASCAIPVLCRPVRIEGRDYVDGAVRKTAHLRRVIEEGASLVLCVNPMVPLGPSAQGRRSVAHLICETVRMTVHGRMQSALQSYATEYPDTDVLVLEPTREEVREAQLTLMSSRECPAIVQFGYRTTVRRFRKNAEAWGPMLARHAVVLRDPWGVPEEAPLSAVRATPVARRLESSLRRLKGALPRTPVRA